MQGNTENKSKGNSRRICYRTFIELETVQKQNERDKRSNGDQQIKVEQIYI